MVQFWKDIATRHFPDRTSSEFQTLIRFVHDLHFRTPAVRARLNTAAPNVLTSILATDFLAQNRESVELALVHMGSDTAQSRYLRELFLQTTGEIESLSDPAQRAIHYKFAEHAHAVIFDQLMRRDWRLLLAPPTGPFLVLADEPVVIHDSNGIVRTGLGHRKSQVSIPISPTMSMQGFLEKVRETAELNDNQVRRINYVSVRNAYREVFANADDFAWQRKLGKVYTSREWMDGIPQASWESTPQSRSGGVGKPM